MRVFIGAYFKDKFWFLVPYFPRFPFNPNNTWQIRDSPLAICNHVFCSPFASQAYFIGALTFQNGTHHVDRKHQTSSHDLLNTSLSYDTIWGLIHQRAVKRNFSMPCSQLVILLWVTFGCFTVVWYFFIHSFIYYLFFFFFTKTASSSWFFFVSLEPFYMYKASLSWHKTHNLSSKGCKKFKVKNFSKHFNNRPANVHVKLYSLIQFEYKLLQLRQKMGYSSCSGLCPVSLLLCYLFCQKEKTVALSLPLSTVKWLLINCCSKCIKKGLQNNVTTVPKAQ